jgi:4-amino-4-deoxy-L-arabinose transferase-like glycosyltransferase
MSRRTAFTAFVAISLVRALLLGAFDLMPQSAYYATYAEHPSLSYYDHPPMIGWLLWPWFALFGKSALTLRFAIFTTTLVTQLLVYTLALSLFGRREGSADAPGAGRALALFATTGMMTQLSFIAVPDVPLLLFWALALWLLHRILFEQRTSLWPAAGVAMGLALLGKYTAVYLQGGLLLFLVASPEHRRHLRTMGPWLALALAHLVALPIYVWNARHGWASFAYQSVERAAEVTRFDWDDALGFLGSQALVFLPIPLFAFLWLAGRDTWRALRDPFRSEGTPSVGAERLFLLCFSVPVFATCIGLSTITWVKSNWPMPAYVAATLLVAAGVGRRAVRWHLVFSALLHAVLVVQLLWYPIPVESDDTWYGWSELAERVEERVEEHPGAFVFSADNYKTTAELRFYAPDLEVYGMNVIGWNALHFEYIGEDPADLAGRDALFVRSEEDLEPSAKTERYLGQVREHFETVREVEPIEIRRGEETVRLFRVFLCRGYRGPGGSIPRP